MPLSLFWVPLVAATALLLVLKRVARSMSDYDRPWWIDFNYDLVDFVLFNGVAIMLTLAVYATVRLP